MNRHWSFSSEWDAHFDAGVSRTWDWDVRERLEMVLLETQLTREEVAGLSVLDAGCGNGELTEAIASLGADVTGIDLSTSINRITPKNAKFIQADINNPPFPPASFDVIFSSGVLHHNSNARASFDSLAKLCKENG